VLYLFKKLGIIIFSFILIFLSSSQVLYAYESNNVIDHLNFLTEEEVEELQDLIDEVKEDYRLELVIVITDDTQGKSSRDFADDYYDYNGYGVGSDKSGLLMLINMDKREVWISTTGKAIDIFTDAKIDKMLDMIKPFLSDGDYYTASKTFIDYTRMYSRNDSSSGYSSSGSTVIKDNSYMHRVRSYLSSPMTLLIAFVIALVVTLVIRFSSKGSVTVDSRTYEETGAFRLNINQDIFLREITTKERIRSDTHSGGGSSTHIGSSGRSHGGGGRSF